MMVGFGYLGLGFGLVCLSNFEFLVTSLLFFSNFVLQEKSKAQRTQRI